MVDVKTHPDHPSSMEQRIRNKYRPSNDFSTADHHVQLDEGQTRMHHTVHKSGHQSGERGHGGKS